MFLIIIMSLKQRIININGRNQTNRDKKSNLLFLERYDKSRRFRIRLLKNKQKALQRD